MMSLNCVTVMPVLGCVGDNRGAAWLTVQWFGYGDGDGLPGLIAAGESSPAAVE